MLAGQDTNSANQVYVSKSSDILTTTTATHHTSISATATAQISTFTGQSVDIQASNALISQGSEFTATDGKLRVKGQDTSAFYEAQNISQSSTTTESTTSLSGLGSMLVMGLPVDLKIDDHSSTDAQASSIALGSVLQSNQAIEVDVGRKATFNGSKLIAPDIIFNNANGSQPGELVLGISTNTTQTSHTERTETAGVYQDMQGSGQTVQTANATLLKGQVSWGDGIHITVEKPVVKTTDSSPGAMQGKGLMGFAIADTANSLVENNPTASGYPSGNTSGKAAIPEQSSRTSLAQSLATLPENMTGLEYLDQLKARKDVNWQAVELAHDRWSYHQEGLTPAGAALVSIAVAMATGGSASGLTAGLTNSVSVNTALAAGLTSLSSQAAVALINNQGDIGKTLDQLGQEKSIQNLVTAMVTAGALDKLGKSDWLTFDGHKLSEIGLQPGQVQDFSANLFKNAVNATSSAAVSAMVSGKPFDENSLADALGSALVTTSTAFGAKGIGDAKDSGDLNTFTHKLAHAVLGCAGGAATQGSMDGCSPGAVGAVVGELAAEYYNPSGNPAKAAETVNFAKLMSALAGVIATGDGSNAQAVNTAAAMGANAAENNFLNHAEATEREMLRDRVRKGIALNETEQKRLTQLEITDIARDLYIKQVCRSEGPECNQARRELNAAINTYLTTQGMYNARLSPTANQQVFAERDEAVSLSNDKSLASQSRLDAFGEFAGPQLAGYAVGGILGVYLNEARAIYAAIRAESNAATVTAQDVATYCAGNACFVAGTMIETAQGPKAIETFQGGELVLSRHEHTQEMGFRPVVGTKVTREQTIYEVVVTNAQGMTDTLHTTSEHPFWVQGLGWIKASALVPEMVLVDRNNGSVRVLSQHMLEETATVFNIEVEEHHTYHVGALGVWVHNANCCNLSGGANGGGVADAGTPSGRGLSVTYTDAATGVATINPTTSVNGSQINRLSTSSSAASHEIQLAAQLENATGSTIKMVEKPPVNPNGTRPKSPDFVFESGPNAGKTGDFMFTAEPNKVPSMNTYFEMNWTKTEASLNAHLTKADVVVLDFTNLTPVNQLKVINWINTLPPAQRAQILIRR